MTHKNFDDDQLEKLLNNAPKLTDERSKDDVLKRLLADERLQDNPHIYAAKGQTDLAPTQQEQATVPTKKQKHNRLPIILSIASLFVLTILAGTMFFTNKADDQAIPKEENFSTMSADETEMIESTESLMEPDIAANQLRMMSFRTSVYEDDLADATIFRIGLAGGAAESVPMTYVIPNERVVADFGEEKPTVLQMYEKYAPQIDEEAMGFSEYHPYKGELKEQEESLVHVLPEKHTYDVASASVSMYIGSLQDTFSDYQEIAFENTDGTPYEFSQAGELSEPLQMAGTNNHYNYYLYTETNGAEYLSPDFRQSYGTVTEALTVMRDQHNDIYVPVVPEDVTYTVEEEAEGVVVTFDAPLDLTSLDAVRATQLVEAMMLTAASFDQQLRLDNVVQDSWEGFDLKNYLPMPVGANKQYLP